MSAVNLKISSKRSINELGVDASTRSFAQQQNAEDEEEVQEEDAEEAEAKSFPKWSTRTRNLMAYTTVVVSFSGVQRCCYSFGVYGGIFLLPYVAFKLLIVMPVVVVEIMLGRYVTGYFVRIYGLCRLGKGILICQFIVSSLVVVVNLANAVYLMKYLGSLFSGRIIWQHCEKPWSTDNCFEMNSKSFRRCTKYNTKEFCMNVTWETSGMQFWKRVIQNPSNTEYLAYSFLALVMSVIFIAVVCYRGIRGLEKILLFFTVAPTVLSLLIMVVTFLIPGSIIGLINLWKADMSLLLTPEVWMQGFEDAAMTHCIGLLVLHFISSHGLFNDDIFFDVLIVLFSDLVIYLFSCLPVLSAIRIINHAQPLFENPLDVYVWVSEALIIYPFPNVFWSFIFYFDMTIIQLSSQAVLCLSVFEATFCILKERYKLSYVTVVLALIAVVLTAPFIVLPNAVLLPIGVIVITVVFFNLFTVEALYGLRKFNDDFHFMMGYHPPFLFSCMLVVAAVLSLLYVFMKLALPLSIAHTSAVIKYENFLSAGLPVVVYLTVVAVCFYFGYKNGNAFQMFSSNPDWGPSQPLLRKSRIVFDSKTVTKEFMYRQELCKKPQMKPNNFAEQNIVNLI